MRLDDFYQSGVAQLDMFSQQLLRLLNGRPSTISHLHRIPHDSAPVSLIGVQDNLACSFRKLPAARSPGPERLLTASRGTRPPRRLSANI